MLLYLDDDFIEGVLVKLLRRAGHDVVIPSDARLSGADDPVHLTHAISTGRLLMTYNHDDFEHLHTLIRTAGGRHAGIIVVRKDNDRRRDMTERGIVHALANLIATGNAIADQFTILNQYR